MCEGIMDGVLCVVALDDNVEDDLEWDRFYSVRRWINFGISL
jgi:hypothetical protein